jgi:hypothetical protein
VSRNVERFRKSRNYNEDDYDFFFEKKRMKKTRPSRNSFYNDDYDNEYQKSTRKRHKRIS